MSKPAKKIKFKVVGRTELKKKPADVPLPPDKPKGKRLVSSFKMSELRSKGDVEKNVDMLMEDLGREPTMFFNEWKKFNLLGSKKLRNKVIKDEEDSETLKNLREDIRKLVKEQYKTQLKLWKQLNKGKSVSKRKAKQSFNDFEDIIDATFKLDASSRGRGEL